MFTEVKYDKNEVTFEDYMGYSQKRTLNRKLKIDREAKSKF